MKDIKDKVVLVTGAASGIGRATALGFAWEGADLVIADIDYDGLKNTADLIRALERRVLAVRTDLSDRDNVKDLCGNALKEFDRVDILINNAGVALYAEVADMDLSEWDWVMGVNLWGPIYTTHYLLPSMVERGQGHIVNVSSLAGLFNPPAHGAYAAAKCALAGMSDVLRTEVERFGIGVTVVYPGAVKTDMLYTIKLKGFDDGIMNFARRFGTSPERMAKKIISAVKKNRPEVIMDLSGALYLLKRVSPSVGRRVSRAWLSQMLKSKEKPSEA